MKLGGGGRMDLCLEGVNERRILSIALYACMKLLINKE